MKPNPKELNRIEETLKWAGGVLQGLAPTDCGKSERYGRDGAGARIWLATLFYEGFDESLCWPDAAAKIGPGKTFPDLEALLAEVRAGWANTICGGRFALHSSGWSGKGRPGVGDVYYALFVPADGVNAWPARAPSALIEALAAAGPDGAGEVGPVCLPPAGRPAGPVRAVAELVVALAAEAEVQKGLYTRTRNKAASALAGIRAAWGAWEEIDETVQEWTRKSTGRRAAWEAKDPWGNDGSAALELTVHLGRADSLKLIGDLLWLVSRRTGVAPRPFRPEDTEGAAEQWSFVWDHASRVQSLLVLAVPHRKAVLESTGSLLLGGKAFRDVFRAEPGGRTRPEAGGEPLKEGS